MKVFSYYLTFLASISLLSGQLMIENLPGAINSTFDEIAPVLGPDEEVLFFTRIGAPFNPKSVEKKKDFMGFLKNVYSEISGKQIENPEESEFNQDIYFVKRNGENFEEVYRPGRPLNSLFPNSACSYLNKEEKLIVLNQEIDGVLSEGFSIIPAKGINFGKPVPLNIHEYYDLGQDVSMCISKDGEQVFISMEREDSKGESDLYICIRIAENLWSYPQPLGSNINTAYRETSPFLSHDKRKLFFASNKPGGLGGQDIYVSNRLDYSYQNWSDPVLLNEPINSPFNDLYPCVEKSGKYAYISSDRSGSNDLYRVYLGKPKKLEEPITVQLLIINTETDSKTRGEFVWGLQSNKTYAGFFRAYQGEHKITLTENLPYKVNAEKRGFTGVEVVIHPKDFISLAPEDRVVEIYMTPGTKSVERVDLPPPFGKKRKVVMRNIYFERAKANVLPRSNPELKKLLTILKNYPSIYITIEGHTDNVGDEEALVALSKARASAIKDYLVTRGINPIRIDATGLGAKFPLSENSTEQEKKRNRRVEIRITKE